MQFRIFKKQTWLSYPKVALQGPTLVSHAMVPIQGPTPLYGPTPGSNYRVLDPTPGSRSHFSGMPKDHVHYQSNKSRSWHRMFNFLKEHRQWFWLQHLHRSNHLVTNDSITTIPNAQSTSGFCQIMFLKQILKGSYSQIV